MRAMKPYNPARILLALTICLPLAVATGAVLEAQEEEAESRHEIRTIQVRGLSEEPIVVRNILRSGGFLGVSLTDLTPELRVHFGAPKDRGLLVASVVEGSGAESAGVQVGDVLSAIEGSPVDSVRGAIQEISRLDGGETLDIEIYRNAQILELQATLGERERDHVDVAPLIRHWEEQGPWRDTHGKMRDFTVISPEGLLEIDPSGLHNAMEKLHEKMESPEWQARMEQLQSGRDLMLERLQQMEQRLNDLEEQLETLPDGS